MNEKSLSDLCVGCCNSDAPAVTVNHVTTRSW